MVLVAIVFASILFVCVVVWLATRKPQRRTYYSARASRGASSGGSSSTYAPVPYVDSSVYADTSSSCSSYSSDSSDCGSSGDCGGGGGCD